MIPSSRSGVSLAVIVPRAPSVAVALIVSKAGFWIVTATFSVVTLLFESAALKL